MSWLASVRQGKFRAGWNCLKQARPVVERSRWLELCWLTNVIIFIKLLRVSMFIYVCFYNCMCEYTLVRCLYVCMCEGTSVQLNVWTLTQFILSAHHSVLIAPSLITLRLHSVSTWSSMLLMTSLMTSAVTSLMTSSVSLTRVTVCHACVPATSCCQRLRALSSLISTVNK